MKYEYETRRICIGSICEIELNEIAKEGWRFVSFVPNTTSVGDFSSERYKTSVAIFEREIYKDKMACGMP